MKQFLLCALCLCCLSGCKDTLGSFEDGTLNKKELIQKINQEIEQQDWNITLLRENESREKISAYGLQESDVLSYGIFPSVIAAIPDEIAIFEVADEQKENLKEKISMYIADRKQDKTILPDYKLALDSYKTMEIGNYYMVVIGKDAQNVIRFMEDCA